MIIPSYSIYWLYWYKSTNTDAEGAASCYSNSQLAGAHELIRQRFGKERCGEGCSWDGVGINACWELYFVKGAASAVGRLLWEGENGTTTNNTIDYITAEKR